MSTSSKYSSNKIKQVIENKTQHFIIKCYTTAAFEYERKKPEYYLYWININQRAEIPLLNYKNISFKRMGNKEVVFFKEHIDEYSVQINSKDGYVWHHSEIGFRKSLVRDTQLSIF